jgi:4-hydroxybenzoate polyprenyltransferase
VLSPALFVASFAVAVTTLPLGFVAWLAIYALTTTAYSLRLKREVLLDVTALAGLYTIRLVAGSAATQVPISSWLATFALFFFVSLALAKRAAELAQLAADEPVRGRGYSRRDLPIVSTLGVASGLVSVQVLALYVQSSDVSALYRVPELLWGMLPLFLYWVGRVWILASRGELHEDPVAFALRDRVSYIVLGLIVLLTWGAL